MASPTVPWGIPLFDDSTPFAPIQAPFNSQSAALNVALNDGAFQPYATKALLDAAPGARVGQHATVYADGTVAYNGDYRWTGSAWDFGVVAVRALVYRTAGVNVLNQMAIPWNAEYWDASNTHAAGATSLIAPVNGLYQIDYQVNVETSSATTAAWIKHSILNMRFSTSEGLLKNHSGSAVLPMQAGEYVELFIYSPATVAVATSATQSTFGFTRIGAL